ncbi:MAG: M20/M25/M40 family metallo-hydrolase [Nitrospirae bacterium]|nr:M20/M25/M40 family metallo-hydrolase [Nitrospirota bacterium]
MDVINTNLINETRVIETFKSLVEIPSPSFQEQEIGIRLVEMLRGLSFEVETLDYQHSFNILARKRGNIAGANSLLLSAHMDTVQPTPTTDSYNHKDGVIASNGATILGADDKSGIAEILEALTVLEETGLPHGDIEVLFTSAEERGLYGAKQVDYGKIRSRYALVLDSSGEVGRVVLAAPTHVVYRMTITGRAAHAGIEPEKGTNSIIAAARIMSAITDGRVNSDTTANVGVIRGGSATNIVPVETVVDGEFRSLTPSALEKLMETTFNTARDIARKNQVKLAIKHEIMYGGYSFNAEEPFVELISAAISRCQIAPVYVKSGGGSDANIFNQHGIMAIPLSTGMQKPHTAEEYIYTTDLIKGSLLILEVLASLAQR